MSIFNNSKKKIAAAELRAANAEKLAQANGKKAKTMTIATIGTAVVGTGLSAFFGFKAKDIKEVKNERDDLNEQLTTTKATLATETSLKETSMGLNALYAYENQKSKYNGATLSLFKAVYGDDTKTVTTKFDELGNASAKYFAKYISGETQQQQVQQKETEEQETEEQKKAKAKAEQDGILKEVGKLYKAYADAKTASDAAPDDTAKADATKAAKEALDKYVKNQPAIDRIDIANGKVNVIFKA